MKKPEKKSEKNLNTKKKYQKPRIVHTKEIETLAGSCNQAADPCVVHN